LRIKFCDSKRETETERGREGEIQRDRERMIERQTEKEREEVGKEGRTCRWRVGEKDGPPCGWMERRIVLVMGRGGSMVGSMPWVRRVAASGPTLAAT